MIAAIKELKNNNIQTYLEKLTVTKETNYSLWKATKTLKRPKEQIRPIKKSDGNWARSDKDKANTFGKYLETVFTPYINVNPAHDNVVREHLESNLLNCPHIESIITNDEVNETIKGLREMNTTRLFS